MLFEIAEIFAEPFTAAVYLYGSITGIAICALGAAALPRRARAATSAGRGDYWLRYVPANAKRRAALAFLTRPFGQP